MATQDGADYIMGTVQSSQGPEAGVWVIAETDDLPTNLIKIVVTDDDGRFALPELPDALYKVWVRGYGLVDSTPVTVRPGADLTLTATVARTPQEAARVYPANYWYSLLEVPARSEFPGTGPEGNGISPNMKSQEQWLDTTKQGCQLCHQLGNQISREITHLSHLGFDSHYEAWEHRVQIGVRGGQMNSFMSRFGHERGLEMYADWTARIAAGEMPEEAPPRPSGDERNIVITLWDWGNETSYVHDEITTDKWNPSTVNAGGPVYGGRWRARDASRAGSPDQCLARPRDPGARSPRESGTHPLCAAVPGALALLRRRGTVDGGPEIHTTRWSTRRDESG